MPTSSSPRSHDLVHVLTRAERLAARRLEAVLDEEGCTLEAWRVLTLLSDGTGHPMAAVAGAAFLPPPTLTKLVDQLVDQNLVHRRIDPLDRRRILAHLTPRGREYRRRLDRAVRADWPGLADGDEELLRTLLERLAASLDSSSRV